MLVDTHAHIQWPDYELRAETVLANAKSAGVEIIFIVGTDLKTSEQAVAFAKSKSNCEAATGLHPHDAKFAEQQMPELEKLIRRAANNKEIVAIGECGLDFYYNHSARDVQTSVLKTQIELALELELPLLLHIRDAFSEFFELVDNYPQARGVIHSFSSTKDNLQECLKRGFYIGLNGIMTFTKDSEQLAAASAVPLDKMLLETDSPFLTPAPFRGKVNEPANVKLVAEFLARLRGETFSDIAAATTANAKQLFNLR